jgi:hypothetical protein
LTSQNPTREMLSKQLSIALERNLLGNIRPLSRSNFEAIEEVFDCEKHPEFIEINIRQYGDLAVKMLKYARAVYDYNRNYFSYYKF